jgi:hypothetical protein
MKDNELKSWMLFPFLEQIFCLVVFASVAPAIWALFELSRGHITTAIISFCIWLVFFTWLALVLHRRRKVHFLISLLGAGIVLLAAWYGVLKQVSI